MKELEQEFFAHEQTLFEHIAFIYGEDQADEIFQRINIRLKNFRAKYPEIARSSPTERVSQNDTILITYGDMVRQDGHPPLQTLATFLEKHLADVVSTVHILPFYPYSSDDGFSVIDYKKVNSDFGSWDDIAQLGENFRLMFDAVVNHVSAQSTWFQGFLKGDPDFEEYFTVIEEGVDLSRVFRPRATPVLTPFETSRGKKLVWTTFSADQIDLNFANPEVLIEVIDILLFYAAHGADFIRLDAVTFVWKEIGTDCINSAQTHRIVQTIRTIFDLSAPKVAVITETNVPHEDNISYFGNGTNEAQMVYNFALPLLTLNAFHSEDISTLTEWAATLDLPSDQVTFFNFLACHDGIGMLPVKNILSLEEINKVVERTHKLGGYVSYKSNEDGTASPYELNINFLDALDDPHNRGFDTKLVAKRFLASQSIMLGLRGVPGIYFHSLFGSRNWKAGVEETERYRTINREKLERGKLERELANPDSLRHLVFKGFHHMLQVRKNNPAFHPLGGQRVLKTNKAIFTVLRSSLDDSMHTLCLTNVTNQTIRFSIDAKTFSLSPVKSLTDLLSEANYSLSKKQIEITIEPYQVLWLRIT
jgi:sucrose phosphorylase